MNSYYIDSYYMDSYYMDSYYMDSYYMDYVLELFDLYNMIHFHHNNQYGYFFEHS